MKQAALNLDLHCKKTRKREFLEQMEQVVPWAELVSLIAPYYPEGRNGRPPFALESMLRIHFIQQWFSLSDPAMEEAFFDTPLLREFARLQEFERLPDESTILRFRHRLDKHHLAEQILATVNALLSQRGLLHGQEGEAFGDAGYQGIEKRPDARPAVDWHIAMRPGKRRALDKNEEAGALIDQAEKQKASVRAKVEHPFRVLKRQFGFMKVRYRGLMKNTAQLITLFALSNLWMVRGKLMAAQA